MIFFHVIVIVLILDDKTKPQVIPLPKKRQNSFDRASDSVEKELKLHLGPNLKLRMCAASYKLPYKCV